MEENIFVGYKVPTMMVLTWIIALLPSALYGGFLWILVGRNVFSPLLVAIGVGGASLIGSAIVQELLPTPVLSVPWHSLYERFVRSALVEELMRYLLTLVALTRRKRGTTPDAFVGNKDQQTVFWGLWGGLGGLVFAALETILYTLRFSGILWIRLLATSLVHGSCGSLVAQGIYKGKRCFFLVCAVAIHGLYNMFVELSLFPSAIPVLFAVLIFFVFWAPLIEKAKKG